MNKDCKTKEWDIKLKAKKSPRFKAGSELADKVNKMSVDINEEADENSVTTDVDMEIEQRKNERLEISLRKKLRFKASGDLTEKVNMVSVEVEENADEVSESSKLKMKLESEENERLELSVKRKNKTRFKPGTDLTEKVNKVAVDWSDEEIEDSETLTVSIKLSTMTCPIQVSEATELQK